MNVTNETLSLPAILCEAWNLAGHRVTLTLECGGYPGARPVYVIARYEMKRSDVRQDQRYVPLAYGVLDNRRDVTLEERHAEAKARAMALFAEFAQDVTDPAALASTAVVDAI
jgi:hypothetical protein